MGCSESRAASSATARAKRQDEPASQASEPRSWPYMRRLRDGRVDERYLDIALHVHIIGVEAQGSLPLKLPSLVCNGLGRLHQPPLQLSFHEWLQPLSRGACAPNGVAEANMANLGAAEPEHIPDSQPSIPRMVF